MLVFIKRNRLHVLTAFVGNFAKLSLIDTLAKENYQKEISSAPIRDSG
jgi:hypothetical protein